MADSTASTDASADRASSSFNRSWRYRIGLVLIIGGHLSLLVGIVLPIVGLASKGKAGLVGLLTVGGEVASLASIAFLGKQGFLAIKSKVFRFLSSGFAGPVGRVRHALGMSLFLASILANYVILLYGWKAFQVSTPTDPWPTIWWLDYAQQATLIHWMAITSEGAFLIAIYVLGADWWDRFRMLFVREVSSD